MICNKVHFKALVPSSKFRTQTTTTTTVTEFKSIFQNLSITVQSATHS